MQFAPDIHETKLYNDQLTNKEIENGARLLNKEDKTAAAFAKVMELKAQADKGLKQTTTTVAKITADVTNVMNGIEAAANSTNTTKTAKKTRNVRSRANRNLEDDFMKELHDLDNLDDKDDNDDKDDKIRNLKDSEMYEDGFDLGRLQSNLTKSTKVPDQKDMKAGKQKAAVTSVSLAAVKAFGKINDYITKANNQLNEALGKMSKIKSDSTIALNSIKKRRELTDQENKYTKEFSRQLQDFYDNMNGGNKRNRSLRKKKKFIDVPMVHEASAYTPPAKYSKKK